jgi:hypothetical protein
MQAACSKDMSRGLGSTLAAGTDTFSAYPPAVCSPRMAYFRHSVSRPARQSSQRPQEMPGFSTTSMPGEMPVPSTPGPTASTMPATSEPRMWGIFTSSPGQPARTQMSRWLSATARTRTTTRPGSGNGSGNCAISRTSGPPWARITIAFIATSKGVNRITRVRFRCAARHARITKFS